MGLVRPCRPGRQAGPGGDRRSAHRPVGPHPGRPDRADRHAAGPAAGLCGAALQGRAPLPEPSRRPAVTLSGDTAHRRRADSRIQHGVPGARRSGLLGPGRPVCLEGDGPHAAHRGACRHRGAAGRGPAGSRAHRRPDGRLRRPVPGARPAAAPLLAAPRRVLGRQRPSLARRGVAPALPARAVQRHPRQHQLQLGVGPRGQPRPRALGRASRHALAGRTGRGRVRLVRGRPRQHVRPGQPRPPADGDLLHRLRRLQPALPRPVRGRLHRLQHRPGTHLAPLRRQPGDPQHRPRQPRREGVLVRTRRALGHGALHPQRRALHPDLHRPAALAVPEPGTGHARVPGALRVARSGRAGHEQVGVLRRELRLLPGHVRRDALRA